VLALRRAMDQAVGAFYGQVAWYAVVHRCYTTPVHGGGVEFGGLVALWLLGCTSRTVYCASLAILARIRVLVFVLLQHGVLHMPQQTCHLVRRVMALSMKTFH
jgi:hypothetical protein